MSTTTASLATLAPTGRDARLLMRSGRYSGHTAGMAPGYVQGNLAILPKAQADVFLRSCQRNPKPCPLLALSEPGDPALPTLGDDIDIRTNLPTVPAGIFQGPLVVSMRPMKAADAIRAVQVTSRFPQVHGAPVHIGRPDLIGIADVDKPDFGEPVVVIDDELPVFWACGVTPQSVVMAAKPSFWITHGHRSAQPPHRQFLVAVFRSSGVLDEAFSVFPSIRRYRRHAARR